MTPLIDGPTKLSSARIRLALLALALGGFGIGSTEFVAMGLLPNIAHDLLPQLYAASPTDANAQAGWIISAYALGVVVGAPTIAAVAARWPRKKLLLWLLVAFTVGTLASAVAPTFQLVMVARFVSALPHGAYFGIASLVAASLMGPGKRGRGVAFVLSGLTIANVIGVPTITWIGQHSGWRIAYLVVAAIFALTFVAVALLVPWQAGDAKATMRNELRAFTRLQVWLALLIGAVGFGGFFAVYTYIAPIVTTITGMPESTVPLVLVLAGLGMTIGNILGGRAADHSVRRSMLLFFVILLVGLAALWLTASTVVGLLISVFVVSGACSALSPTIQTRLMDVARDSQSIAAALNHSALNIANAAGAFFGGLTIAAGLGYLSPVVVGGLLALGGIALALISFGIDRSRIRRGVATGSVAAQRPAERTPVSAPID
ncbi:MFS transporter [Leifsonia sp. 21MFCrub1.1]|uniref:MFS transporter n=1 Tax=Leifsonia sp. 21MFCrub1.1 TaxID=1798223 RepID=UPI0008929623|nr:MFS transporter [Leifsonia sp. 21MFCrub1.1]SEA99269.1 MFS transporter, DHA1 family, arabinose polymer transporter [Leifsonia sp. 21MFCrub1.1]